MTRNTSYQFFIHILHFLIFNFCFSMRFYNPTYQRKTEDEKPILQPGLHEYTNPVHTKKDEAGSSLDPKNSNQQDV